MNKLLLTFFICSTLITGLNAQAEICNCTTDVMFLYEKVRKTPSYKSNKEAFDKAYKTALDNTGDSVSYYSCFQTLNTLILPLKDWHMGIIQKTSDSLERQNIVYPQFAGDLDSLTEVLKENSLNEIEGIYHGKGKFSFGLAFDPSEKVYKGIVLNDESNKWNPGEIIYTFIPIKDNIFKVIGGQYRSKNLISYYERVNEGVILRAGLKKDTATEYYIKTPYPNEKFIFKELSPTIDYLKLGSFSSYYPLLSEAEQFYRSIDGQLNKPHLVLDLRDNGGGGDRNSDIIFKQLKKYLKDNRIYIITNASTGSNAEQFTVKLKKYDNVTSFGDKSRGALSYEIRGKDYHTLPSTNFLAILPSKAHKKFIDYETKGVVPDKFLDYSKNWISQVKEFILNQD